MGKRRRFSAEFKREAVALTAQPDVSAHPCLARWCRRGDGRVRMRVVYLPPVLPGSLPSSGFRCSWK